MLDMSLLFEQSHIFHQLSLIVLHCVLSEEYIHFLFAIHAE